MSRFNRPLTRAGIASLALGVASVLAAPAAGASTTTAAPAQPTLKPTTPMCLVGAALLYPMFLGGVLITNPSNLVSAAPGYWTGNQDTRGRLGSCGLGTS